MAEIRILVSDQYGDFDVHGVVEGSEEDAERLLARIQASDGDRKYRLGVIDTIPTDVRQVEVLTLSVEIFDDDTIKALKPRYRVGWPWAIEESSAAKSRWIRAPMYEGKGGRLEVSGTDADQVRWMFESETTRLIENADDRQQVHDERTHK